MHGRYCRWQHALVDVCSIHLNSTVNTHTHTHTRLAAAAAAAVTVTRG